MYIQVMAVAKENHLMNLLFKLFYIKCGLFFPAPSIKYPYKSITLYYYVVNETVGDSFFEPTTILKINVKIYIYIYIIYIDYELFNND